MFKFKRTLLQKTNTDFKLSENQAAIYKQHESTHHRAKIGSNLCAIGPYNRSHFPLLKLEERDKEFFIRTGKFTIQRYYVNEYRHQVVDSLFYPTDKAMRELDLLIQSGRGESDNFVYLYKKLLSDGAGSTYAPKMRNKPKNKLTLKRKEEVALPSKRFQLKKLKLRKPK
jgi:hypothetical protein